MLAAMFNMLIWAQIGGNPPAGGASDGLSNATIAGFVIFYLLLFAFSLVVHWN